MQNTDDTLPCPRPIQQNHRAFNLQHNAKMCSSPGYLHENQHPHFRRILSQY